MDKNETIIDCSTMTDEEMDELIGKLCNQGIKSIEVSDLH